MASELLSVLFKRRSQVDGDASTFESSPELSSADASHLVGLSFDAPAVQQWLLKHRTPEEDRIADLLAEGLKLRGVRPAHAPPLHTQALADTTSEERRRLLVERELLESHEVEVAAKTQQLCDREAEIAAREEALRQEQGSTGVCPREEVPASDYALPPWLEQLEGTANVGVVGDSGVGKSLLINKLRHVEPGSEYWAPVGVSETTTEPTMYPFPNENRVRFWDLPGAGTTAVPREGYIARMGLRHFDAVLVVSACRFTETEVALASELQAQGVPYFMVRSKVDVDVWNNREDNKVDELATLEHITKDLKNRGVERPYLISSRQPDKYDTAQLMQDVFPSLKELPNVATAGDDWSSAWALPETHSPLVAAAQGRWDNCGTSYLVCGLDVHVTRCDGSHAETKLTQSGGCLWWISKYYADERALDKAASTGQLKWIAASKPGNGFCWFWSGYND